MTHTTTVALLEISAEAYDEIESKARSAGYDIIEGKDEGLGTALLLHGIGLIRGRRRLVTHCSSTSP